MRDKRLTVVDFFCGAGGFSEGFQQAGFEIVSGYDNWEPAANTYNHNFGSICRKRNILDFEKHTDIIDEIPDTDVIIGSPPCVSFSSSNRSGKADKSLGLRLTETFLKIIAVKKFKKGSKLKYWVMENVPNSIKHLPDRYTFEQLGLAEWAAMNGIMRSEIAITIQDRFQIINSAEYGSAQSRVRAFVSEDVRQNTIIDLRSLKCGLSSDAEALQKSLGQILDAFPQPPYDGADRISTITDPNYGSFSLSASELTDHYYDSGLSQVEWEASKFLKVNHPYMGKMSFPEREDRPSRTVTATNIGTSRESMIIKSRDGRIGDGEYRLPTVREMASLMGFPINYQFIGGHNAKIRLVGNAVCPTVSRTLANAINLAEDSEIVLQPVIHQKVIDHGSDLRHFRKTDFSQPKRKNKGSRFRRHPLKSGGLTVTLSNYDIAKGSNYEGKWYSSIQYGTGVGFFNKLLVDGFYESIFPHISILENGNIFIAKLQSKVLSRLADRVLFQEMYESQIGKDNYLEPTILVSQIEKLIKEFAQKDEMIDWDTELLTLPKSIIPKQQILAMYAINIVSTELNLGIVKSKVVNWNEFTDIQNKIVCNKRKLVESLE